MKKKSAIKKATTPIKQVVKKPATKATAKPVKKNVASKSVKKVVVKPVKKVVVKPAIKSSVSKLVKKGDVKINKVNLKVAKTSTVADKKVVKSVVKKVVEKEKNSSKAEVKVELKKVAKVEKDKGGKKVNEFGEVRKTPKRKKKKQKHADDEDEPIILDDILIDQLIKSTKRQSKVPKVPKILKTFVNPMTSLTVASPVTGKKGSGVIAKEPKGKFELEYVVRTSVGILYELLTTPSGLSEWFADDVNIRDGIFTFFWDGSEQKARLLGFKEDQYVKMQWLDKPEGSFFEFRIQKDELTGDISLIITDFADEASDLQTSKLLWDSQVNTLLNVLGSN